MANPSTYRLGTIEVLDHDLEELTYPLAVEECERLGAGWRIPTPQECNLLQEFANLGVGGFDRHRVNIHYWTSQTSMDTLFPTYLQTWKFDSKELIAFHPRNWIRSRPVKSL